MCVCFSDHTLPDVHKYQATVRSFDGASHLLLLVVLLDLLSELFKGKLPGLDWRERAKAAIGLWMFCEELWLRV